VRGAASYGRVATPSEVPVIKTALLAAMLTLVAAPFCEPVTYR